MKLVCNELELPEIANKLSGPEYEELKGTLIALILSQRLEVFENGGGLAPWKALAKSTMRSRRALLPESTESQFAGVIKPLISSGVLRGSFTNATGPGNDLRETQIKADEVAVMSHVAYAKIQNDGGVVQFPGTHDGFGRGVEIPAHAIPIPARPIDEFRDSDVKDINELMEKYLNG